MSKHIYLAGPMTGWPGHNFDTFRKAAERLKTAGWIVVNPAENFGGRTDLPRETYMRTDVATLARCDAIALLPGWQESRGAKVEYLLAREMGLKIIDVATLAQLIRPPDARVELTHVHDDSPSSNNATASILDEAKQLTSCDRQVDYGHPSVDFGRAAMMWTGILQSKLASDQRITAGDVALCMIAIKLARQAHRHKRDNLVDIAGYARTAAMIAGEE